MSCLILKRYLLLNPGLKDSTYQKGKMLMMADTVKPKVQIKPKQGVTQPEHCVIGDNILHTGMHMPTLLHSVAVSVSSAA